MCVLCKESDWRRSQWTRGARRLGAPRYADEWPCGQWRAPGAGTAHGHVSHSVTEAGRLRAVLRAASCSRPPGQRARSGQTTRGPAGTRHSGECAAGGRRGPCWGADRGPTAGLADYVIWGPRRFLQPPEARSDRFWGHLTPSRLKTGLGE